MLSWADVQSTNPSAKQALSWLSGLDTHVVCGRVLEEDEGEFSTDDVICMRFNAQSNKGGSLPPRPPPPSPSPSSNSSQQEMEDRKEDEQSSSKKRSNVDDHGGKRSKKKKAPPPTTGWKKTKAPLQAKIALKKHVKIQWAQLFHILKNDSQQASIPKSVPNNFYYFGTVTAHGKNKSSWNVRFDVLPFDDNVVENIACTKP